MAVGGPSLCEECGQVMCVPNDLPLEVSPKALEMVLYIACFWGRVLGLGANGIYLPLGSKPVRFTALVCRIMGRMSESLFNEAQHSFG